MLGRIYSRRRFQRGQLLDDKENSRWCARWREDQILPAGTPLGKEDKLLRSGEVLHRTRKWDVIGSKKDLPTRRLALRILDERLRGINSVTYKPILFEKFGAFADRWMQIVAIHHKPSTQQLERRQVDRYLKVAFGPLPMHEITAEAVQAWVSSLPCGPKTVKNLAATLKTMWKTARVWGYVQHDPFEGLRLPRSQRGSVYQFTAAEVRVIVDAAKGWHKTLFSLLFETGMRPGEAAGLRPEDINGVTIHVRQSIWRGKIQTPKTEHSVRQFALSTTIAEQLKRHITESCPNRHGLIFVNKDGNPLNMDHLNQKSLRPILERLGIWEKIQSAGVRCGSYAFRHGNVTELSRSGVPLKTIQARVGHAAGSDVTMNHYIHAASEDDRKAANHMEALLGSRSERRAAPPSLTAIENLLCESCRRRFIAELNSGSEQTNSHEGISDTDQSGA